MKGNTPTYTLDELVDIDIDLWVEAMGNLAGRYGHEVDGYDPENGCPAEYEAEFAAVAERHAVRFDAHGRIEEADGR